MTTLATLATQIPNAKLQTNAFNWTATHVLRCWPWIHIFHHLWHANSTEYLQTHIWIRVPGCWQPENFSEMQVLEIRHCRWSTSHRHHTSQWSAHTWLESQNASRISVQKRSTRHNVIKSNLQLSVVPSHPSLLPVSFFPGLFYVGLHWFGIFVVSIVATRAVVMRQRRQWQAQAQTLLQHHRRSRATWTTCFGPAPKTISIQRFKKIRWCPRWTTRLDSLLTCLRAH